MKTLVICTAMSAMILCACGGKNTQSTEETQIRGNNKIRKSHFFIQIGLLRVIESFMRGKV